ncbi:MAG: phenazine biosynthesis protein PhzF [Gammaproteobacteria bacterium HGW-Gammaproteobacteria-8]|nr:MAG: phenazine biosynthesis protein PhzF [Gammaproteobacteria bacterium HGW-Gammaproteobacteria-8]
MANLHLTIQWTEGMPMTAECEFETWDVFTATRFAGNPLAVLFDADGVDVLQMQAVTREFDYSESVFIQAATLPGHDARLRIFTPAGELPFAGHPTVGAACALARRRGHAGSMRLELGAGSFAIETRLQKSLWSAEFVNPNLPRIVGPGPEPAQLAAALGLAPDQIAAGASAPRRVGAGIDFIAVQTSAQALVAAKLDVAAFDALAMDGACGLLVYAIESDGLNHQVRARMFAPHIGVPEDPATGSAAAALPAHLFDPESMADGLHRIEVLQGGEMGRPSRIEVSVAVECGCFAALTVAGQAVPVARGTILA